MFKDFIILVNNLVLTSSSSPWSSVLFIDPSIFVSSLMRKKSKASFTLTTGKCIICSLSYKTKSKLTVHKKEHKFHFREFTQHVENTPFCWLIRFIVKGTLKVVTQRCLSATVRQCCLNQAPFYLHAGPVVLPLTLILYGGLLEDINLTALLFFLLVLQCLV